MTYRVGTKEFETLSRAYQEAAQRRNDGFGNWVIECRPDGEDGPWMSLADAIELMQTRYSELDGSELK